MSRSVRVAVEAAADHGAPAAGPNRSIVRARVLSHSASARELEVRPKGITRDAAPT